MTIGFTVILFQYRLVDKCLLLCWRSYHRIAQSTQRYNRINTTKDAKMASGVISYECMAEVADESKNRCHITTLALMTIKCATPSLES
jgi:hypothetical protein